MGDKSKILVFIDWYFPGYKAGGPIQSCRNLVSHMKDDFTFYIFTSDRDLNDDRRYNSIRVNSWNIGPINEHIYYTERKRVTVQAIADVVDAVKPSAIYLNSMFSYSYTILPIIALKRLSYRGKIILAPRGMLQEGALSFKPVKKKIFLAIMQWLGLHKKVVFHATDEQELFDINAIFPNSKAQLALNIPKGNMSFATEFSLKNIGSLRLVFYSRIHEKKNLTYVLELFASYLFKGTITFDVYGEFESNDYHKKCLEITSRLPENICVNFLGGISNDVALEKFAQYHAFILPTLGENFGHAIYEALMSGVPVIISDKTPWRNLEADKAGWDLSLSKPQAFACKVSELLEMDQQTHMIWREGARNHAKNYIQLGDFKNQYRALFL